MNLKGHMQVLLEAKKQMDEPIENDLRKYAGLSTDIEAKKKAYKDKEDYLLDMEKCFSNFVDKEVFSEDSIHIKALKQEMKEIDSQLVLLHNEIGDKQKYYDALSKSDYMVLAAMGTEEGCIAAIERLYSTSEKSAKAATRIELAKRIEDYLLRGNSKDKIAGYLILNYLIYCEQHGYISQAVDNERELYDNLIKQYAPKSRNKLWESIEPVYQSYEVQQLLNRCVRQIAEFEQMDSMGDSLEESFDKTCQLVETQMKRLLPAVKGIRMALSAGRLRRWYRSSFLKTDRLLRRWNSQNRTFRREHEHLKNVETRLRRGMEEGMNKKECADLLQTLDRIDKAKESFASVEAVRSAVSAMTIEFDRHVGAITMLKNNSVRRRGRR